MCQPSFGDDHNQAMRTTGTVSEFDEVEGWGVIDTPLTPGGCWVGFAAINMPGYRRLRAGDSVVVDIETANQDGFEYRAIDVWPEGVEPGTQPPDTDPSPETAPSAAYRSRLILTNDDGQVLYDSEQASLSYRQGASDG